MAFNGSGSFVRDNGYATGSSVWQTDEAASRDIESSIHDTHDQDIADGLSNCICKDGQTTITADLPMATYKHTGVGNAAARNQYAAAGQIQDSSLIYGTTGGTADTYTLTLTPAVTAYTAGQTFVVKINTGDTNTGASTLNVNGLGAKGIFTTSGVAMKAGQLGAGSIYLMTYDGTQFRVSDPTYTQQTWTPTLSSNSGLMTFSSSTINSWYYFTPYNTIRFAVGILTTLGGTADTNVRFDLPVTPNAANVEPLTLALSNGSTYTGRARIFQTSSPEVEIQIAGGGNYSLVQTRIQVAGEYEA